MTDALVDVVVVGGGKAGSQVAVSLRDEGFEGSMLLLGDEGMHPYDRPPLSKGHLVGAPIDADTLLRPPTHYSDNGIEIEIDAAVSRIDARARTATVAGRTVAFGDLVLATGATPRALPVPGAGQAGVSPLRTIHHAADLRSRLGAARSVVVIGGGFVGLEVAAVAATHYDCRVTVIEALPRLLARTALAATAEFVAEYQRSLGVDVMLGTQVTEIRSDDAGAVSGVVTDDGTVVPADVVVYGIGVIPRTELASDAGIEVQNGILVDASLETSAEHIWAIGDCAAFPTPFADGFVRLESVQNATDQARFLAAQLHSGERGAYRAVPWFWSDQADLVLQSAGLAGSHDETVTVGDPRDGSFSVLAFRDGRLIGGDSVNARSDHLSVRRVLDREERGVVPALTPAATRQTGFSLKEFSRRR